jgi:hypothetical protein
MELGFILGYLIQLGDKLGYSEGMLVCIDGILVGLYDGIEEGNLDGFIEGRTDGRTEG